MNAAQVVENLKQRFPNEPEYIHLTSSLKKYVFYN